MDRREYLGFTGGVLVTGLAGCSGDGGENESGADTPTPTPEPSVSPVDVSAENHDRENAPITLTVQYATRATDEFESPDGTPYSADGRNKYLLLRADVTVESELDGELDVYGSAIVLEADGVVYDHRPIPDFPSLTQTVVPETTYEAWGFLEIPEDATAATLRATEVNAWFDYPTAIVFEAAEDLSATMPDG